MNRNVVLYLCLTVVLLTHVSSADTVTHFGDGVGTDIPALLNMVGIGASNAASETTATAFVVPGAPTDSVDLTFTFQRDTGAFLFDFGFYDATSASSDPISAKQAFATEALTGATVVFDDRTVNPGAVSTHTVAGGTTIGFFLVPNNTLAGFLAAPDSFYPPIAPPCCAPPNDLRSPLFSNSDANPGEFDQMLSFVDGGITLFSFEDLTRIGTTDADFTDLAFTVDAELIPIPEPSGLMLCLVGICAISSRIRRPRVSSP